MAARIAALPVPTLVSQNGNGSFNVPRVPLCLLVNSLTPMKIPSTSLSASLVHRPVTLIEHSCPSMSGNRAVFGRRTKWLKAGEPCNKIRCSEALAV
jgi:hypothetical protein